MSNDVLTHYEVLGLTSSASHVEIRNAFLRLSKQVSQKEIGVLFIYLCISFSSLLFLISFLYIYCICMSGCCVSYRKVLFYMCAI